MMSGGAIVETYITFPYEKIVEKLEEGAQSSVLELLSAPST
jgi:hypothetical protein